MNVDRINLDSDSDFLNVTGGIRKSVEDGTNVVDVTVDLHHNPDGKVFVCMKRYDFGQNNMEIMGFSD